ncbi:hypothetical protein NP493_1044g00045 [Ridgeia piscesae]|uniref:Uncharacterized protein n=1 Tax=Ridgeia piscesae TaxID=27915 RepID=A0AAD9NK63_RIDPI|nr:hypothetical protein NP493_1044g00045 [Ridgeia piscesae]
MAATFSVWDYVVFSLVLLVSLAIGFYHALAGGRQQTTAEDNSGTVHQPMLMLTDLSPGDTVLDYLEMRYQSKFARTFGAMLFIIRATLGMGIVLFGPAVSLNAVTGFPTWTVIILIGAVCIVYTTLGGMKAVIWTDVFQTFIMLAGMLAIVIQGTMVVGGLGRVWSIAEAGGRIHFDPDPTVRHTFWTLVIGSLFVWLPPYTVDQQMIQRFACTRSLRQAVWALLLNIPGMFIIITLCSLSGLLLPRFVMDVLGFVPGLPGLFVASLFSGAFSSVSSMLNSLAAVTWEDFLKQSPRMRRLPDKQATYVNKGLVVVFAVLGVGMAFVFSLVGGTVLQGVVVGGALGCALPMWISIGAYVTKPPVMRNLPRSVAGCFNASALTTASLMSTLDPFTSQPITLAPSSVESGLTISFVDRFCRCLPLSWRQRGRCDTQLQEHGKGEDRTGNTSLPGNSGGINTKL